MSVWLRTHMCVISNWKIETGVVNCTNPSLFQFKAFFIHPFFRRFSAAKKCSTGGRALMQLDFIQLISKLEAITTVRPIPYRDLVEVYIKAYYQPEEDLETWIKEHAVSKTFP